MRLKKMTLEEFHALTGTAMVPPGEGNGQRVFETADNRIAKLCRSKKMLSSNFIYSYARRFLRNSLFLREAGVQTVTVESLYDVPEIKRQVVIYSKLPGTSLGDALKETSAEGREEVLERLACFVAMLHDKGILFRSIHFDNVIMLPPGDFALIDISDLKCYRRRLQPWHRFRNFRHLCRRPEDAGMLQDFGWERFVNIYLAHSGMGKLERRVTRRLIMRINLTSVNKSSQSRTGALKKGL